MGAARVQQPHYLMEIETDASLEGWGAFCHNQTTGGCWDEVERTFHINFLELDRGSLLCPQVLCQREARIVHSGEIRQYHHSVPPQQDGRDIVQEPDCTRKENLAWCLKRSISLKCQYLPGWLNTSLVT